MAKPSMLYCSFCGKNKHEVKKLIAGPATFCCDECVGLFVDMLEKDGLREKAPAPEGNDAAKLSLRFHDLAKGEAKAPGPTKEELTLAADILSRYAAVAADLLKVCLVLKDPEAVRHNILRGEIVVPSDLVWLHDTNGPVAEKVKAALAGQKVALEEAQTSVRHWRDCSGKHYSQIKKLENELALAKLQAEAAGSLLLDVQKDCIAATKEKNAALQDLWELGIRNQKTNKWAEEHQRK